MEIFLKHCNILLFPLPFTRLGTFHAACHLRNLRTSYELEVFLRLQIRYKNSNSKDGKEGLTWDVLSSITNVTAACRLFARVQHHVITVTCSDIDLYPVFITRVETLSVSFSIAPIHPLPALWLPDMKGDQWPMSTPPWRGCAPSQCTVHAWIQLPR